MPTLIAANVVVVAGKGGVGKTTVTAVIARAAADTGLRVLVVELDGKPLLATLVPGIEVRSIAASDALDEYLREKGFTRVAKRLATSGVIDVISTAAPGIDDIVVLGKIKQLERSGQWDLIVVDGPAAGHAITFLTSAKGMLDSVRGGPVYAQAKDVMELLGDPERCQVVLVTLPETTPVNEVIETTATLVDRVGVRLGPIVINGVDTRTRRARSGDDEARPRRRRQGAARGGSVPTRPTGDAGRRDRPARAVGHGAGDRARRRCRWPDSPPTTSETLAASLAADTA